MNVSKTISRQADEQVLAELEGLSPKKRFALTSSKRVLIVSQFYWPEGTSYAEDLAIALSARGHRVRVITGYPNYPAGEIYPGYRQRWRAKERIRDIQVLRVPLFIDHSQSAVRRALNYSSFGLSVASARDFARNADVVYVYATQMTAAFGPWLWRVLGGTPYVLHVQDLWPDSIVGSSLVGNPRVGGAITRTLTPGLREAYRRAAGIVGIAPTMVRILQDRGAAPERTHLVYNWSSDSNMLAAETPTVAVPNKDARIRFIFAGNTGDMQDLETLVRAAHLCRDDDLEVLIVGDGIALPRLRQLADQLGAAHVKFTGAVPESDMPHFYRSSDFGLVTLKDLPAFRGTIPSKLQAQLAFGLPVVTTVQGDVRSMVEANGLGFAAEPENPESLAAVLREAASISDSARRILSDRALETFHRQFAESSGVTKLEHILVAAARKRRARKHVASVPTSRESRDSHE